MKEFNRGWAIVGNCGIYIGWWLTRREAIKQHTTDLGKSWSKCRSKGDRAVKIQIIVIPE